MSECVVRMEFRKNCLDCDLHQIVYGDSYADTDVYCFKEKRYIGKRFGPIKDLTRPDWCPVICQLPEGHGRLIDADSMGKDLNYDVELDAKALDDMNIVGYARERFQFDKNRKQDCIRYLSGQKTIVPAEAERSE